ncbi:enoyl-[acyl-carrier-protein] reductase [nadh] chloroplastic [Phtheirospermum japonicum]|uniref:Enoyl-[acyl-carrier-protein] reductase [nadh] chloroplastic n=1 Tax=Phtheirospermum japonicum TaxID=374723 RepID=A0A830CN19_9LAMI|nr:enoyl-[acyl-carrier-protein] reductase [nadh] chloroplastic [Phtheirospermum japonicum]
MNLVPKPRNNNEGDKPNLPHLPFLPIDLRGYGWAIAKSLAAARAEILVGVPVDALDMFNSNLVGKKFDKSRKVLDNLFKISTFQISGCTLMEFKKVYGLDACYEVPEDVPEEVKEKEAYRKNFNYTVKGVFQSLQLEFGSLDILVHSAFKFLEVSKSLVAMSRSTYIDAICKMSYPLVALAKCASPIMNPDGSIISVTYNGSQRIIPTCGLGISSSLAASKNDVRMLAYDVGWV